MLMLLSLSNYWKRSCLFSTSTSSGKASKRVCTPRNGFSPCSVIGTRYPLYPVSLLTLNSRDRFPMDIVFRIYDNCLASGIEAMFTFSIALLSKNEGTLLSMKFDQLVVFLNQRIFEVYRIDLASAEGQAEADARYRVDEFVQDALSLRITPFMLDNYAREYEELVRARDAHRIEVDGLKAANHRLSAQV